MRYYEDPQGDTRSERQAIYVPPEFFEYIPAEQGAWHESGEDVAEGLAWGERKQVFLDWVRNNMAAHLTACERGYFEKYYFEGMNYAQIAEYFGIARSSACRAVNRAVGKLRQAALAATDLPGPRPARGSEEEDEG